MKMSQLQILWKIFSLSLQIVLLITICLHCVFGLFQMTYTQLMFLMFIVLLIEIKNKK